MLRLQIFLGLLLLLTPQPGLANGTSVGASQGSPLGGIVPLQNKDVRLVSEKLTIKLRDGVTCVKAQSGTNIQRISCTTRHYDVVARYTLANPRRAVAVLYGVPLISGAKQAATMARSVRIRVGVGGREHRCTIPVRPPQAPASLTNVEGIVASLRKESAGAFEGMAWESAWCVAPITIPRAERVVLELRYTGEFLWDDWDGPGCAYYGYSRHLLYPLAPAGYWAGRPDAVDIRVELGRYGRIARVVGPAGHRRSPTLVEWHLVQPELKRVTPIHLVLDLTWHQHDRIARMNQAWPGALVLAPAGRARSHLGLFPNVSPGESDGKLTRRESG